MSVYGVNYQKLINGYLKIIDTINSITVLEQLEYASIMVDNWLELADVYCDRVHTDRTNKNRKKDASNLADVCHQMFEELKSIYQARCRALAPEEYEGRFRATRVKSLPEMVHEQNGYENGEDE